MKLHPKSTEPAACTKLSVPRVVALTTRKSEFVGDSSHIVQLTPDADVPEVQDGTGATIVEMPERRDSGETWRKAA